MYDFQELLNTHANILSTNTILVNYINEATSEYEVQFISLKHKIWHLLHQLKTPPICPICKTNYCKWQKTNNQYSNTCGYKCSTKLTSNNGEVKEKRKNTCMIKYGGIAPACNKDIVDKATRTKIGRYGTDSGEVWKKKIQTAIYDKYGVDNPSKLQEVNNKKRFAWKDKSEYDLKEITLKRQQTWQKNYGVNNPQQDSTIREKTLNTNMEKYGVFYPIQNHEIYQKVVATNLKRYGTKHPNQSHLKDIIHLIEDYDWLYYQYVTLKKPSSVITSELNDVCWYGTILDRLKQHDIKIRRTGNYSYSCLMWLTEIELTQGISIQHALSDEGEFLIPGTNWKADGYCKETNTIYEFYGDLYHGNPKLFGDDKKCHPFNDKTAKELYDETMLREQQIVLMGFDVISIWENDWLIEQKLTFNINKDTIKECSHEVK